LFLITLLRRFHILIKRIKRGMVMAIKVIANWPYDDPEEMHHLQESLAKATLVVLRKMFRDKGLGANDLDTLMQELKNERLRA
jgi:hypothetical protein